MSDLADQIKQDCYEWLPALEMLKVLKHGDTVGAVDMAALALLISKLEFAMDEIPRLWKAIDFAFEHLPKEQRNKFSAILQNCTEAEVEAGLQKTMNMVKELLAKHAPDASGRPYLEVKNLLNQTQSIDY